MEKIIKRGLKSLRFLINWILKMAKKLLNLDTTSGALSFEDSESLPSGTTNQTLRHDGTNWVANSGVQFYDYSSFGKISELVVTPNVETPYSYQPKVTISTGDGRFVQLANINLRAYASEFDSYDVNLEIDGNGNGSLKFWNPTTAIRSDFGININNENYVFLCQNSTDSTIYAGIKDNGTMLLSSISGLGSALLEATSDGTIQRSATALTKTKIINRVLTSASSIHSFDNTDLGISGDLRDKIISFELLRKTGANDYFSLGELVQTDKTITSGAVTFATGEIPIGDTIRLAITYTD